MSPLFQPRVRRDLQVFYAAQASVKYALLLALIMVVAFIQGLNAGTEERIRKEAEIHAGIYQALAKCLNEPVTLTVANEPVSECKPVRSKR